MEEERVNFFEWESGYRAQLTWICLSILLRIAHWLLTGITIEFRVRVFIEVCDTVAFFMKTLITVVAVNDFIFLADIGWETYFTVSFEDIREFWFGLH